MSEEESKKMSEEESYELTKLNKVKRLPKRGQYTKKEVHDILKLHMVANVAFNQEIDGQLYPMIVPMNYGVYGDILYLHGHLSQRILKRCRQGEELLLCVNVTLLDGLVLARSMFHHSVNYRSVVIHGKGVIIEDNEEKMRALHVISDFIALGRWHECRTPTENELKSTAVIKLDIDMASAKVRTGPPIDDKEDIENPPYNQIWGGVIPLSVKIGEPIPDDTSKQHNVEPGEYIYQLMKDKF